MTTLITVDHALDLIQRSDYVTDLTLIEQISEASDVEVKRYREGLSAQGIETEIAPEEFRERYSEVRQATLSVLATRTESFVIQQSYDPTNISFGVSAASVFHLENALRIAFVEGLGLFFAIQVSPTYLPGLFFLWFGASLKVLIEKFLDCYERIASPQEKLVFGAVYRLQNQLSVVNYDALSKGNFNQSFGKISPRLSEILDEIGSQLDRSQVEEILFELKRRSILEQRDGHWSVRFW